MKSMFKFFNRNNAPLAFEETRAPMTPEQVRRLVWIATDFNEALESLPPDNPTRLQIEADREDLRRARRAGEQFIAHDRTLY